MERKEFTYNGQEMTRYEASQYQRYLERNIRAYKRQYLAEEAAGVDTTRTSVKLAQWRARQKDFLDKTGLDEDNIRHRVSGFGHSQASKAAWTNKSFEKFAGELKNVKTSTGVLVSDVSMHVYEQAVKREVNKSWISSALTEPLKTGKIRKDRSQQFIGERATVVINVDTGKVVTAWRTSSKRAEKLKGGS